MAPLPVAVLLGVYLGVLTGIVPGLVAFTLGFLFRYVTGVTVPAFAVVVLGVAIAGVNGGLLALVDPSIVSSAAAPTLVPALVVVLMVTMYAHSRGDTLGASTPRRVTLRGLRRRTLAADVVRRVGERGRVRVRVVGEVGDVEGYPPLSEEIRREIRESEWTLQPASLADLEAAVAERLRAEFDLADVQVEVDERARAVVRAAPPLSGLSKRIPSGQRAVSVETLVPTGLARGDRVTVRTDDGPVEGTVVSVRSGDRSTGEGPRVGSETGAADGDASDLPVDAGGPPGESAELLDVLRPPAVATGGPGRITVAVDRTEAVTLLAAAEPSVVVQSRGTRREFELVSLLRRVGLQFRKLPVGDAHPAEDTLGELDLREAFGVAVLAVRRPRGWTVAPRGDATVDAGDEVFAVGTREALDAAAEALG